MVEVPWGRASEPVGVAPETLEEFLTPSRVISPNLQKRSRHLWWKVSDWLVLRRGLDVLFDRASAISPRLSS